MGEGGFLFYLGGIFLVMKKFHLVISIKIHSGRLPQAPFMAHLMFLLSSVWPFSPCVNLVTLLRGSEISL